MEKPPPLKEQQPPIKPTEIVIGDMNDLKEQYSGHPLSDTERTEAFESLHRTLDQFENHDMKVLYDEHRVPTFDSLEKAAARAQAALELAPEPEAKQIALQLSGRIKIIKKWCRSYIASILKFRITNTARMRMNNEEQRELFEKADHDRRRVHDALLESIGLLNTLLDQGTEYAEYEKPAEWDSVTEIPPGFASEHPLIFSRKALADRDLIRDWAIVADQMQEIEKITGMHH